MYATANPPDDGQIVAKSTNGGGSGGWQFKTSPDTGPHTFGVAVSTDGTANAQRYSTTVRQLNTWYFVAGVYDAADRTLDIYVNGATRRRRPPRNDSCLPVRSELERQYRPPQRRLLFPGHDRRGQDLQPSAEPVRDPDRDGDTRSDRRDPTPSRRPPRARRLPRR